SGESAFDSRLRIRSSNGETTAPAGVTTEPGYPGRQTALSAARRGGGGRGGMGGAPPAGTVTLVFTDIEGSPRRLATLGQEEYGAALGEHRRLVRAAFAGGYEVDCEGDSFFYAFSSAEAAADAVTEAMQVLDGGPIRIRVGVHTGAPALDPPKYV